MEEIIIDYKNGFSINDICKKYHIGKLKVKTILKEHNIGIRNKGNQKINNNFIVNDYHIKKYIEEEGFHYVAIDRNNGFKTNDFMNEGGILTSHIKKTYGVKIPSLYDRRLYYMSTGNYWWEQWFNIIKEENKKVKKCPYCEWETIDTDNKSGAYTLHILSHNISIEEHLIMYPEDKCLLEKQIKKIEKENKFSEQYNFVECPICGKKMNKITYSHLKNVHNIGMKEFKQKYPNSKIMSDYMLQQIKEEQKYANLYTSKNRFISKYEKEIQNYLINNNIIFETNRQILIGKEIDILINDKKIGIEFNGLKFHTEWFGKKERNYHLNKTIKCNEKGYKLLQIFEDEYVEHKDIVFNKIAHIICIQQDLPKIMGRKCKVEFIDKEVAEQFLNDYHIQGFARSTVYLGAVYNNNLVAVMSFKQETKNSDKWELTRFASDYHYVCQGIGGKLFNWFVKNYNPSEVKSFADRRWTLDKYSNLYTKLGFALTEELKPNYRYYNSKVDKYKRFHKFGFRKQVLSRKYGFPLTMTETEMVKELGYDKIWDCGLFKYVWKR